ncbi:sensor histidine kinase [Clostridium botulinum B str. Osaka05]|uniref:Sensor histidine kinase n=1 Tax=Clostridium botulinum B str. Osaka05 TaxID=1407017 RepID=A0A0S6U4H5_CLOBO|nr:sensor histidine kinase [Clostridium botulinum B str. Osaka05]
MSEIGRDMYENIKYYKDIWYKYRKYIDIWAHEIKTNKLSYYKKILVYH